MGKKLQIMLVLSNGDTILEDTYTRVLKQVEEIVPALEPSESYTLETLCGEEFWNGLAVGERRMAGRYIAHVAKQGPFPLEFVGCKHQYPKKYRLK